MPLDSVCVAIADDSLLRREATSRILRTEGWKILACATAAELLHLARDDSRDISLILLNIQFAGANGFELHRQLRQMEKLARVPIIFRAPSFSLESGNVPALETGVDGCLAHAVEPAVLIATSKAFLRAFEAEGEIRQLNAKLAEPARQQEELLAKLAHDLRNPLSPLTSALALMEEVIDKPEQLRPLLELAQRQTQQLIRLVEDLRDGSTNQRKTENLSVDSNSASIAVSTSSSAASAPANQNTPRRRKVLVVDDMRPLSYLLGRLIERLGHEVQIADSAPEALDLIANFIPDVIFTDLTMPKMNGYEFAAEVRRRYSPAIQLVAMTGQARDSDRQRALAEGFNHFMLKPPESAALQRYFAELDDALK